MSWSLPEGLAIVDVPSLAFSRSLYTWRSIPIPLLRSLEEKRQDDSLTPKVGTDARRRDRWKQVRFRQLAMTNEAAIRLTSRVLSGSVSSIRLHRLPSVVQSKGHRASLCIHGQPSDHRDHQTFLPFTQGRVAEADPYSSEPGNNATRIGFVRILVCCAPDASRA